MRVARKTLRFALWATAVAAGVPLALYVFALVVNLHDRPPTPEALAFAAAAEPEPIPDADNAYVYLLGFGAPRESDPAVIGAARADWIRELAAGTERSADTDPYPNDAALPAGFPAPVDAVSRACGAPDAGCVTALDAAADDLRKSLAEQRWLIERYRALLDHRAWREVFGGDPRTLLSFSGPAYARRLYWLDTWLRAVDGDAADVRARLDADLLFWRLALAESDLLIDKLIAARYVADHFEQGNLTLRRLPLEHRSEAIPASWRKPLTDAERSMRRAFTGEWRFALNALTTMKAGTTLYPLPTGVDNTTSALDRFSTSISLRLLQPQDSANRYAATLSKLDATLSLPYTEIPAALARAPELEPRDGGPIELVYNFVGDGFFAEDHAALLVDYGARVADLEGVRRAALLVAELRGLGAAPALAAVMIPLAATRNPYTGGPYEWTADPPGVSFAGLEHSTRARHRLLY